MRISAVIPTLHEAEVIADAVRAARAVADEVVVADADSGDETTDRAAEAGARVVLGSRGRGAQLAAGARAATGDVLLFLHADCTLPPAARRAMASALADARVVGGNFRLVFTPSSPSARLFAWANDVRRRWLRIYYGDSAPFMRRATYEALGGFATWPLFEDYDLLQRLERHGPTVYVRDVVVTASARRFAGRPLRTLGLWTALQALYGLGVAPARLARFYKALR